MVHINFRITHGAATAPDSHPVTRAHHYSTKSRLHRPQTMARRLQVTLTTFRAVYRIPVGMQILTLSVFLIYFDGRVFLSLFFEANHMLPACQADIGFPSMVALMNEPNEEAIPMPGCPLPLGYGVFELPKCPRCFLGYQCWSQECQK